MHTSPSPGGLSLFPNPNASRPPAARTQTPRAGRRSSESREQQYQRATTPLQDKRAQTPQADISDPSIHQNQYSTSPPRHNAGRRTPLQNRTQSPVAAADTTTPPPAPRHEEPAPVEWPLPQQQQQQQNEQEEQLPPPRFDPSRAMAIRSSIAKHPLNDEQEPGQHPPALRSIFPTYNPELPLDEQEYVPTQVSPKRIPRAVISRQSYHHRDDGTADRDDVLSPARSPQANSEDRWGHRQRAVPHEAPTIPKTSTTEQLKSYWKVANGWQAAPSEGRVYCMKLAQEKDAPRYTLSSATQPFYSIRLDPTSASAYVTVSRLDPNKPYKESGSGSSSPSSSTSLSLSPTATSGKHWQEALTTTMEEESRRHRPNDGLVALLMPSPATKMAIERAADPVAVATAENECGRLVWDDDSGSYFLVHPALATPFCVTIERSPAWSRVEYTLEHHESPRHLAKLTRDATGAGWLEIDTGLASKIQAVYVADVAVTALVLVASADEKNQPAAVEAFEPPPLAPPAATLQSGSGNPGRSDSALSRILQVGGSGGGGGGASSGGRRDKNKTPMEAFEIDIESQDESVGKSKGSAKIKEGIDKLPFVLRVPVKMLKALFTFFIWILTIAFKCFKGVFGCCYKCVGSKY